MGTSDVDDENGQSEKVQMNFLASQSQRERWEEYAEQKGFRNLSGLFRFAIENEVDADSGSGDGAVSEELTEQLSEMVEGMNRIEERIHDLDNRLATIETEVREDPSVKKLASEVFGVLPTHEEVIEHAKAEQPRGSAAAAGTIEGIASEVDEEEYRVEQALSKLQQDTHQVRTMILADEIQGWDEYREGGDVVRYYKEA